MEGDLKEVYFYEYCHKCKNEKVPENSEPCDECLGFPGRINSHKPEKFEPK